jgi:signal transduction histidine kinase
LRADLRGPVATGLLLLGILTWQATSAGGGASLAAVGVGAVLFRGLFAPEAVRRALHPYADALDLLVSGALVLMAMALTGGIRSPFALLLFADLLLIRASLGTGGSRFHALVALLGLGALAGAGGAAAAAESGMVGLAVRVLWPLPVLLAMEVGLPRPVAEDAPEAPAPLRELESARRLARVRPDDVGPRPPSAPVRPPGRAADTWGAVAHDLRSPLSVIRVYADLIAEQAARGEPARPEHVRNLGDEIELMETLLAGNGPRPVHPEPARAATARAELVRMLGSLSESYRLAQGERLRIEFVAERAEVPVAGDPASLQRVFRNLLDNAVKFTPPGGRVRVRVGTDGAHALVTVSDTGVGMTPEERAHAFEYSFRGRAARGVEGRGLGLTVSRELLERSGGTIALSSEQGQGSDVIVRLPLLAGGR